VAKVIQFPVPSPEKFGFRKVQKKSQPRPAARTGQLPLFGGAKVVKINPDQTYFEEALMLDEAGDGRAGDQYLKAIEAGDSPDDAYCNLGILESRHGNTPKAIDCFSRCLALNPRHFEAHYNLANLYAELGNLPLAKVHYQVSIEVEPDFPNSYYNLGLTLAINREYKEAVKALRRYRELASPDDRRQTDDLLAQLITVG
jgi:Flp pilus assembly protein TadD